METSLTALKLEVDRPIEIKPTPTPTLEEVFRKHFRLVYQIGLSYTGNTYDADDVVQNTFLQLARGNRLYLIECPSAYIRQAAVHQALKIIHRRRDVELTANADLYASPAPVDSSTDSREEQMLGFIESLRPAAALLVKLRYLEGLSNFEIAQMLGKSEAVVAVTLFRLRRRLKKLAKGEQ